jgi:hypothetical protein
MYTMTDYLGVARQAVSANNMGNKLPVIVPFHLFGTCIRENWEMLSSLELCRHYQHNHP